MSRNGFFKDVLAPKERDFQNRLGRIVSLIAKNQSVVAQKVHEVIKKSTLPIHSFYGITKQDYEQFVAIFKNDHEIELPKEFPPSKSTIRLIEQELNGIILNGKSIYINSNKHDEDIAKTLLHEIVHHINEPLYEKEKAIEKKFAQYCDEVRARLAEKMFATEDKYITRSSVKEVHLEVKRLYQEFDMGTLTSDKLGYIFSCYDQPTSDPLSYSKGY